MLSEQSLDIAPLPRLVFGVGAIDRIGELVAAIGPNVMVITDMGVRSAGVADRVEEALAAGGLNVASFDGVHANPIPADVVDAAASLKTAFGDDPVVVCGVGGGSAMDTAKSVALAITNPGPVAALDYRNPDLRDGLAVVCVPTTAGTGSETNAFGVLTDHETNTKLYPGNASTLPRLALCDPALTMGVPPQATANTGMDALTHAVEAMSAKHRNDYADGLCLQVAHLVSRWLPVAVDDGADIEARSQMLLAAHLAGVAMATGTGQGACHGLGHALSTRLGVAHGAGLAALLPHVMRFNLAERQPSYARLALAMGAGEIGAPDEDNALAAIAAVEALSARVGTAKRLGAFGLTDDLVGVIAQDCLDDVVTNNAPRYPTHAEASAILHAAR